MRIGYACLTLGVPNVRYKSCILKNATPINLKRLIEHNLNVLATVIDYNIENDLKMFRISSDLIPFGSHPVNTLDWQNLFSEKLNAMGQKAINNGIRLSMHPGQYTVLNSPNQEVVQRAILDLKYHCDVLNGLGLSSEHKIILHIGGIYGDKRVAIQRFIDHYQALDDGIKERLIIENDDKSYTIEDALFIAAKIKIPVVFDNLHHAILHGDRVEDEVEIINRVKQTWKPKDGDQKIHYSEQALDKKIGSHSETVKINTFMDFYQRLNRKNIDIMLEVKDKNLSALKCIHATTSAQKINELEVAWSRYKYLVLHHSPQIYQQIRQLLKDKKSYPVLTFYNLIEEALIQEVTPQKAIHAAEHVWGYFKKQATDKEKNTFKKEVLKIQQEQNIRSLKKFLFKLAQDYQVQYLLNSYYFIEFY